MDCMVSSTFDWDQLGKILQHSWKKYLKISSKVVNFESDLLKTNEDIALQRREIYRHLHGGGGGGGCGGGGAGGVGVGGGGTASLCPPSYPATSYGLFAESGRVYSVQNSFGTNWCETSHFFGQEMTSNQQVIGKTWSCGTN